MIFSQNNITGIICPAAVLDPISKERNICYDEANMLKDRRKVMFKSHHTGTKQGIMELRNSGRYYLLPHFLNYLSVIYYLFFDESWARRETWT